MEAVFIDGTGAPYKRAGDGDPVIMWITCPRTFAKQHEKIPPFMKNLDNLSTWALSGYPNGCFLRFVGPFPLLWILAPDPGCE